ncbi:Protein N-terminal glutamine amidohydrolase [Paramecium bursaria]
MLQQKLGDKNGLVIWDYHVILIQKQTQKIDNHIHTKSYVFDYDTVLPWGMQFDDYFKLSHAFKKPNDTLKSWFHLIDTEVFIKNFASDRSHMKINGKFSHPPPDYPPIKGEQAAKDHNLFDFLDIENKQFGKWMQEDEIQKFFSARSI